MQPIPLLASPLVLLFALALAAVRASFAPAPVDTLEVAATDEVAHVENYGQRPW